ncbi:MAG TPA: hypothetical protein VKV30_16395 [Candidatus Angelobacter sp.]|nr:hypothetical protein [Candidatus Angelobacter sp.]
MALFVGQVVLCLCIWKKRFLARLRWFSILTFFATAKDLLLFAIAFRTSYSTYYYAFYIGNYIESALVFLTLIECGRQVLPGLNLPQKEKALAWLLTALGAVVIFAALWPMRSVANEKRIEVGAYLAIGVVFIFVAAYSRYLGLYWSRLLAGITATLGLLYLVEGSMEAIIGHYPSAVVLLVRQINGIANILAVITWIVVILSPWGEREMTEQDLLKIEAAFARIEASVGIGRS